ncbi:hypothetical protein BGZ60DRAFT_428518 [Tricladium varicosporioides]|nr:hypothetical protein BGZ60DRAFT_428518 [Hymenoscyphus varicosporioides]
MFHKSNFRIDSRIWQVREYERAYEEKQWVPYLQLWVQVPMGHGVIKVQKNPLGYIGQERDERRRKAQNDKMTQNQIASTRTKTLVQWRATHNSASPTPAEPRNIRRVALEELGITYSDTGTLQDSSIGEEIEATSRGTATQPCTANADSEAHRNLRSIQIGDMPAIPVRSPPTNLWRLLRDRGPY